MALRARAEPVRGRDRIDPCGRVDVRAISLSPQAEPEVLEADRQPDQAAVARQDEAVCGPDPRGRQADERLRVGVAADDPVERHDVGGIDRGGPPTKSPSTNSIRSSRSSRRASWRATSRDAVEPSTSTAWPGAGPEQLLIDDADPTADVEDGRAG